MLRWGATPAEIASTYPGDDLVPGAEGSSTMATTLPAGPETVWPWLVQMGTDRAGWYSWDRFDHGGKPSADRIVPEWQHLSEGQQVSRASAPGQKPGSFTVVTLEPDRTLVLRSSYGLFSGRDFDPRSGLAPTPWVQHGTGVYLVPALTRCVNHLCAIGTINASRTIAAVT